MRYAIPVFVLVLLLGACGGGGERVLTTQEYAEAMEDAQATLQEESEKLDQGLEEAFEDSLKANLRDSVAVVVTADHGHLAVADSERFMIRDADGLPRLLSSPPATREVRTKARQHLDSEQAMDRTVPYDGSIEFLRETGLRLDYALMRISAHHWIHAGAIVELRSRLGHDTDQYFGPDWGRGLA